MKFCSDCKHKYIMSQSPCTECRCFNKMEKGNPAVALLENIKAEIDTLRGCYNPHLKEKLILESDVMQIIDNHIAELKGEKNEL